jgi:hypothetical protein
MFTSLSLLRQHVSGICAVSLLFCAATCAFTQCTNGTPPEVLTAQYNVERNGVNPNETCLTPVTGTFYSAGGSTPVFVQQAEFQTPYETSQAGIFAQPLYFPNLTIGGGTHNVIFAAALNSSVYAYDADKYGTGTPPGGVLYWSRNLVADCNRTVNDISYPGELIIQGKGKLPMLGIVSTPVLDNVLKWMYVVGACKDTLPQTQDHVHWYLHALTLADGTDPIPAIEIAGGVTNSFGSTPFTPDFQLQRAALTLVRDGKNFEIYIPFGAGVPEGSDQLPYHGWLFGYTIDATSRSFVQQSVFTSTPEAGAYSSMCNAVDSDNYPLPPNWCGESGGIWMSGRGPGSATINGTPYLFAAVSNGGFQTEGPQNWGESVLEFPMGAATVPSDSFTSSAWYLDENENDEDMGTGGVVLFDGLVDGQSESFLAVSDKAGNLFLLNQNNLGGFNSPDNVLQEFQAAGTTVCPQTNNFTGYCNEIHSMVFFNNTLYIWGLKDYLRAYTFSNGQFVTPSNNTGTSEGFPGGILAITANGTSGGVIWATVSHSTRNSGRIGTLIAFNAATLEQLWASTDTFVLSQFGIPTVVNGRVYLPTLDHGLLVYSNH